MTKRAGRDGYEQSGSKFGLKRWEIDIGARHLRNAGDVDDVNDVDDVDDVDDDKETRPPTLALYRSKLHGQRMSARAQNFAQCLTAIQV